VWTIPDISPAFLSALHVIAVQSKSCKMISPTHRPQKFTTLGIVIEISFLSHMQRRTQALIVLLLFGIYSSYMIASLVQWALVLSFSTSFVNVVAWAACALGLSVLWNSGIFRYSPLRRFQGIGVGLYILSILMRVMHWPYPEVAHLLGLLTIMVVYAVHFSLKQPKGLRDILRLLVVLICCTMVTLMQLHWVDWGHAYWTASGIIAVANLEYVLHPIDAQLAGDRRAKASSLPRQQEDEDDHDLKRDHPDLFQ
jgi:hypothetical protein